MEIQCPFQIPWKTLAEDDSLVKVLLRKFVVYDKNLALVDTSTKRQWRYGELRDSVQICVATLKSLGVIGPTEQPRNRVALISNNCPEVIIVHLACGLSQVVCACLDGQATVDELWHQVDLSDATHLIAQPEFISKLEEVRKKAQVRGGGRIKAILALSDVVSESKASKDGPPITARSMSIRASRLDLRNYECPEENGTNGVMSLAIGQQQPTPKLRAAVSAVKLSSMSAPPPLLRNKSAANCLPAAPVLPVQECYLLFFSSGTTGLPKPVELSHASVIINLQQMSASHYHPPTSKDRLLAEVSMHHIYGCLIAYYGLFNGCQVVTLPAGRTTAELCSAISDYKITCLHTTMNTVMTLANHPTVSKHDMSSVQSITCAGAPLDVNIANKCKTRLNLKDFRQSFGMTETSGAATWGRYGFDKINSVGTALPGMLLKVVNVDTRATCPPNQGGELMIKGPQVTPTYYKNPRAKADLLDSEGWVKTGDYSWYDEEGYIFVADRIKDVIRSKGTQICPSEVEAVLRTHAGIDDCAIVGRSDHVSGEVPAAFVVRASTHANLTTADVRQHCQGKIAGFKELRGGVFFISEVPRSSSGKIKRKAIRQQWERGKGIQSAPLGDGADGAVKKTVGVVAARNSPSKRGQTTKNRR